MGPCLSFSNPPVYVCLVTYLYKKDILSMLRLLQQLNIDFDGKTLTAAEYSDIVNKLNGQAQALFPALSEEKLPEEICYFPCNFKIQEIDEAQGTEEPRVQIPALQFTSGVGFSRHSRSLYYPWCERWCIKESENWRTAQVYGRQSQTRNVSEREFHRILQNITGIDAESK